MSALTSVAVIASLVFTAPVAVPRSAAELKAGPPTAEAGPVRVVAASLTGEVKSLQLVTDGDGVSTAVWESGPQVFASRTRADGSWRKPIVLGPGREPLAAVDSHARVTVAFRRLHSFGVVSRRWVKHDWQPAVDLSWLPHDKVFHVQGYRLAVNARGDAIIAWGQQNGYPDWEEPRHLVAAFRPHDGEWTTTVMVARSGLPEAAFVDNKGRASVIDEDQLYRRTAAGKWRDPLTMPVSGGFGGAAGNGAGDLLWVGLDYAAGSRTVTAFDKPAGEAWYPGVQVATARSMATVVPVVLDPAGRAAIGYPGDDGSASVATRSAHGAWAPPVVVSAPDVGARYPTLAWGPKGALAMAWIQGPPDAGEVWASVRPPGSTWTAPVRLSGPGWDRVADPSVAMAPDGTALVIWSGKPAGQDTQRIVTRQVSVATAG